MSISGIVAVIDPSVWETTLAALEKLHGISLHQREVASGRLVLTQEADSVELQMAGLERVQQTPGVRMADLVYHYVGDEAASPAP